jgi:hypothetical protein
MAEQAQGFESIATGLNTENIRDVLRRTMVLGLPSTAADQPTFYFDRDVDWTNADSEENPWDWTTAPDTTTAASNVQVLCAYEFFSPLGRQGAFQTEVGEFNPTTLVLTLFEDEFAAVTGFTYVTIGPSTQRWYFRFYKPSVGLNDLTVYEIHCSAQGIE